MSKKLQLRRGTTEEHANFTGAEGEITFDTNKKVPVLHDGITVGGMPAATEKHMLATIGSQADGISGFIDRDLDLEISETNAVVGVKNRYAKFGNEIVDLYDAQGNYKSIDLADTVPDVQMIGSTPLAVTDGTITDTDVATDAVVGTDATIPAHNNGHQTKITCNVTATTNGMEVQILDKSDSNNVIRTQTLDSHESKKTLEFWLPANADGYLVHCIKRINDGSGDESIVVSAKGYEDLVTTDIVEKSNYTVIDKEELADYKISDNATTNFTANNDANLSMNNRVLSVNADTTDYPYATLDINTTVGTKYVARCSLDGVTPLFSIGSDSIGVTGVIIFTATNTTTTLSFKMNGTGDDDTATFGDIFVTPVDDIFRATEDIPLGTSVYDSRFSARDYVSNQQLVTLKQDTNGTITAHTETLFEDATETDCNLDRDNVMLKNGFSMAEDGLFAKGTDKHIVVGLWQGLNKGAYHPVFNFAGVAGKKTNGSNTYYYDWYRNRAESNICAFDQFTNICYLNGFMTGSMQSSIYSRPDSKFYDVLYKNDFIELHTTIQEDTLFEAEKRRSAYYSGFGGVSGLVSTIALDDATTTATSVTLPILSNNSSLVIDIIGDFRIYKSSDTTSALQTTSTDTGSELRQNALVWNVEENRMYKYKDTDDRDNVDLTAEDFTVDAKWGYIEKGYLQSFLDRLSEGKPLANYSNLVDVNDGSSLVPDGTKTVFLLSKPTSNIYNILQSSDNGKTWSVVAPTINTIANTITFDTAPSSIDLIIISYTKANNPMQISTPKPITYVSPKVVNSSSHSIYQGNLITNAITGGISTSNELVKFESKVLENAMLDNAGLIITEPMQETPTLSSSTSKASKSIFGVAVDGSKHYDMIFGQGLIEDSGYNSTKFTNLTNGTTVDDAGHTVNTKILAVQTQYKR